MANENEQQGDWQEDEVAQWTSTEGRHMISKGRNVGYWKNGRSLEGTLVPMPVFMRSALMQGRREALGLTLEDVAEKVGVNKSTIQRYESGKIKRIPNDVLDKLEELYGASLREAWVDNTKQPERTEQTTPVSIVQNIRHCWNSSCGRIRIQCSIFIMILRCSLMYWSAIPI